MELIFTEIVVVLHIKQNNLSIMKQNLFQNVYKDEIILSEQKPMGLMQTLY